MSDYIVYLQLLWRHYFQHNINYLQRIQNRAARILTGNYDYVNIRGVDIVKRLKWMNVSLIRDYVMALPVYKCFNGISPSHIYDCIIMCNEIAVRHTIASTRNNISKVTNAPLDIISKNSFSHRGSNMERLPEHMTGRWHISPHPSNKCKA